VTAGGVKRNKSGYIKEYFCGAAAPKTEGSFISAVELS
jgi:hypothetical protein